MRYLPPHDDRPAPVPALGSRLLVFTFWSALGTIAYTYAVFPLLTVLRGLLRPKPYQRGNDTPSVSAIIAAHNEAAVIEHKLDNLLALDYPEDRLDVVVVSDGSDDGTDELVRDYRDPRVRLLAPGRVGKAAALNVGVAVAAGDILVFTDANGVLERGSLRALVGPFADPAIGGVAGDQRYVVDAQARVAGRAEALYWALDRVLKSYASRAGNAISATGAIYAIRRTLFEPVPDGVTDDFYVSTGVVSRGRRLVFEPEARAYEAVAGSSIAEYRRKVRVISQGLRSVIARRDLLDVRRHGWYSAQLFSHKVLRRAVALDLLVVLTVAPPLARRRGGVYRLAALGQLAFYGLAGLGAALPAAGGGRLVTLLRIPTYFCMVNLASLRGLWNLLLGRRITHWQPFRDGTRCSVAATDSTDSGSW